jgi:hypothetical protein
VRLFGAIVVAALFAACSNIDTAGSSGSTGAGRDGGTSATSHSLTIHVTGNGSVVSTDPAVSCAADCTVSLDSSVVLHLNAAPAVGSQFDGWQGACSGAGPCTVAMTSEQSVSASFSALPAVQPGNARLSVQFTGSGAGSVTSAPAGIDCPSACSMVVPVGTRVDLTPHPDGNSTFVGFGGACSGTSCSVVVNSEATAFVNFAANAPSPPPPPPPPPTQPPAQCNGITPGPLPAAVSITTSTQATCSVGIGDRTGTLGLQSFGNPGDDLHIVDAATGTQIAVAPHPNQDGFFVPTTDGFIGLLHSRANPQPLWFSEYWNHRGNFVSSGDAIVGSRVFAGTPAGTVAIAGNFSLSGRPARPQLLVLGPNGTDFNCAHDLASAGTVFGLGGDAQGRVLVITDGGAGRIAAQWFDGTCTPNTGAFTLIANFVAGEHTFFDTGPLIGGGVAVRRVDEKTDSAGVSFRTSSWLVTVPGGNASVQPAPQWLTTRPNTTLALARGGNAYALLPLGEPGVTCSQQVDVFASDGTLCGSVPLPIADGQCRTQDLGLSLDGTPIQLLPSSLSQPQTCAYRWWPFALR